MATHEPMTVIGSEVAYREPATVKIVHILVYGSTQHFTTVIAGEKPLLPA
jgi:hypothetical protein